MAGHLKFRCAPCRSAGLAACGQAFGQDAAALADPTRPPSVTTEAASAPANADSGTAGGGFQTIILRSGR